MTATERFVKDAVTGGFNPEDRHYLIPEILLDPLAWQSRTRWLATKENHAVSEATINLASRHDFNKFMDGVWDGKTIEESLIEVCQ